MLWAEPVAEVLSDSVDRAGGEVLSDCADEAGNVWVGRAGSAVWLGALKVKRCVPLVGLGCEVSSGRSWA